MCVGTRRNKDLAHAELPSFEKCHLSPESRLRSIFLLNLAQGASLSPVSLAQGASLSRVWHKKQHSGGQKWTGLQEKEFLLSFNSSCLATGNFKMAFMIQMRKEGMHRL